MRSTSRCGSSRCGGPRGTWTKLARCSYSTSAGKVTCDSYDVDRAETDPLFKVKKCYVFSSQFDVKIFPNMSFVENNGRGDIAFGHCELMAPYGDGDGRSHRHEPSAGGNRGRSIVRPRSDNGGFRNLALMVAVIGVLFVIFWIAWWAMRTFINSVREAQGVAEKVTTVVGSLFLICVVPLFG